MNRSLLKICGAAEGIRTPNRLIRSQMLYPLSHCRSDKNIRIVLKFRKGKGLTLTFTRCIC